MEKTIWVCDECGKEQLSTKCKIINGDYRDRYDLFKIEMYSTDPLYEDYWLKINNSHYCVKCRACHYPWIPFNNINQLVAIYNDADLEVNVKYCNNCDFRKKSCQYDKCQKCIDLLNSELMEHLKQFEEKWALNISEALHCKVDWNDEARKVTITGK